MESSLQVVSVVVCLWFAANKPNADNLWREQALVFKASLCLWRVHPISLVRASLPPLTVILNEFRRLKTKSQDPLWDPATSVIQKREQPWNPLLHRNPWLDNAIASPMKHEVPAKKHVMDVPWWIPSSTQCPPGNHIFRLTHLHAPATAKCPPSQ